MTAITPPDPVSSPRQRRHGHGLVRARVIALMAVAGMLALTLTARAWSQGPAPATEARQVTLFGVIATPGGALDPRLARVAPQLQKLLPGHGFRLLGVQSKRLGAGETLVCPLTDGFAAAATLVEPIDDNGKVQLRCAVLQNQAVRLHTSVSTPPNQLFFCEKPLGDGTRLLVGVGAR